MSLYDEFVASFEEPKKKSIYDEFLGTLEPAKPELEIETETRFATDNIVGDILPIPKKTIAPIDPKLRAELNLLKEQIGLDLATRERDRITARIKEIEEQPIISSVIEDFTGKFKSAFAKKDKAIVSGGSLPEELIEPQTEERGRQLPLAGRAKIIEETEPLERTEEDSKYLEELKLARNIGQLQTEYGQIGGQIIFEGISTPESQSRADEIKKQLQEITPEKTREFYDPQQILLGTAELTPLMEKSIIEGSKTGLIAATGASGIALASGVGIPALPPIAGISYTVGQVYGSAKFMAYAEGGLAYYEMKELGIEDDIAIPTAQGIGVINAGIEMMQLKMVLNTIPGFKGLLRKGVKFGVKELTKKSLFKRLLKTGINYVKFLAGELTQEEFQEITTILGTEFAKDISNKLDDTDIPKATADEVVTRLQETFEGSLGLSVLGIPGTTARVVTDIRTSLNQEAQKLQDDLAEITGETPISQIGPEVKPFEDITPEEEAELQKADFVEEEQKVKNIEEVNQIFEINNKLTEIESVIETDVDQANQLMADIHETFSEEQLTTPKHEAIMKKLGEVTDAKEETKEDILEKSEVLESKISEDDKIKLREKISKVKERAEKVKEFKKTLDEEKKPEPTEEEIEAGKQELDQQVKLADKIGKVEKFLEEDNITEADKTMAELHKAYTEEQLDTPEHKAVMKKLEDAKQEEVAVEVEEEIVPEITQNTLEYNVEIKDDKIVKTPKKSFEFKVKSDYIKLQNLEELSPKTEYSESDNTLTQEIAKGRFVTEEELNKVRKLIEEKGYKPTGILTKDVIVDNNGNYKVVDVGNFEKIKAEKPPATTEEKKVEAKPTEQEKATENYQNALTNVKKAIKDERGSFSFKESTNTPLINDIKTIAKYHYDQGKQTIEQFTAAMKESLSEVWDKIKGSITDIYNFTKSKLKEEAGFFGKHPDTDRGIKTADMDEQQYPFVAVMAGEQTKDESMKGYKIDGRKLYNRDAPELDIVLEEISDQSPYVFNKIEDSDGKVDTGEFISRFDSEYDRVWNEQNQEKDTLEKSNILEEGQRYQELMEKLQDVKHGKIPQEFRKHLKSVRLPSRAKASRLFGLLGNKNTSIPLFENIYEQWVEDGVEAIYEPYSGAFTLGTHALTKAIDAGLKEYNANVFDKEKFMIIQAIKDGKSEEVIELINKSIEEFTVEIYKEAEKHPVVEKAFAEFTAKYPDSYIGSNDWRHFAAIETNYGVDAVNYPDIYEEFRATFQAVMNKFAIDRTEIKNLKSAVKMAFSNIIGVFSGKGQNLIGSNCFKSFENIIFHPKYGMIAAINQTAETMKLAKEKGTEINIYTEDGVEFLNRLDEADKPKTGIYLDPPYIRSALTTYEEQSIEDRALLNKFMNPDDFIESHNKAILATTHEGARIALTNDSNYKYMNALRKELGDPAIFIYKEGSTPTSLIVDSETEEVAQQYFDKAKQDKVAGLTAAAENPEITTEKTNLRHLIHATVGIKGIPKAELQRITKKITGHTDMSGERNKLLISADEYEQILEKITEAYPRRSVKGEVVITQKTEAKIQELKNYQILRDRMTQEHFETIVKAVTGNKQFFEPRYIHRHKYVTNSEGRQILKAMIDSSTMISRQIKIEKAVEDSPIIEESLKRDERIISRKYARDQLADVTSGLKPMLDMRYFTNLMERATGIPFGRVHMELINSRHEADRQIHDITEKLHEGIDQKAFRNIINNEGSLLRIQQEVASKLPQYIIGKPDKPGNITTNEKKIADYITKTLKDFEDDVRFFRFMEYYNQHQKNIDTYSRQEFVHSKEEWIPNAPVDAIREAVRILESKGTDSLRNWLDKQTWGVVRTGYDIGEVVDPKLSRSVFTKAAISKAHLQARNSVVYYEQDRDIVTRFASYVRQMVYRSNLNNDINSWTYMVNANLDRFTDPRKLKGLLQDNLTEVLGRTENKRFYEKIVFDLYAQAARTIFLNPKMGIRNLMQNVAFHNGIVVEMKGAKRFTKSQKDFFETHVTQMQGIIRDLLYQQYNRIGRIPGFKQLNQFADWANIIGRTDTLNRMWDFSLTTNRIKNAIKAHPQYMNTTTEFNKMMKKAGLGDLTSIERIHAKEILATDGAEAFTNYVAGQVVKKDHFQYERYLRAPAEQGSELVKLLSNLTTFPKGYLQRQLLDIKKMSKFERDLGKGIGASNRAISSIVWSTIIGQAIATAIYQLISGDDDNDPYSFANIAFKFSLGGIALGAQKEFFTFTKYLLQAATGDEWAQKQLPKTIPRNLNMFVPIFKTLVDVIESTTNTKYIDHFFLKKLLGQKADIEDYKLNRGTVKSIQHGLFGTRPHTIENKMDLAAKDIRKNGVEEGDLDYYAEELNHAVEMEYITQDERMKMWDKLIRANDKFITGE